MTFGSLLSHAIGMTSSWAEAHEDHQHLTNGAKEQLSCHITLCGIRYRQLRPFQIAKLADHILNDANPSKNASECSVGKDWIDG